MSAPNTGLRELIAAAARELGLEVRDPEPRGPVPAGYPEELRELRDVAANELVRSGVADDLADDIALRLTERLRQWRGGCWFYVPKGATASRKQIEAAIVAEFNGANHKELAVRYGTNQPHIYEILRKARAERLAEQQTDVFEAEQ
jgi:Mor family transcriptional regulator